jgi:Fe-S cluster assembly scaffold protein SufB
MTHIGKNTRSRIISKVFRLENQKSYRGLVSVMNKALEQETIRNVIRY